MSYIKRYLESEVTEDLNRKMVFIGGPRQSGKTTLAKHLLSQNNIDISTRYLNWDDSKDRELILNETFPAGDDLLVLDEIHKYSRWQQLVKGLFDKRGPALKILITGSARLDYYRRGGDSLQGRYHFYRLFPFTIDELNQPDHSGFEHLFMYGGFPEPFSSASETHTRRWSREYRTRIVRGDLQDLERVQDIDSIEKMVLHLPNLVGSPLSLNGLREDLQVSHQSVSRWMKMLENLFMVFRIYPFGAPNIRAVKKEAKHYHWDWTVIKDPSKRFENIVACHILKWCCFLQDSQGREMEVRYFRDIDRREVDFVVLEDNNPIFFIECKTSDKKPSRSLLYLKRRFPAVEAVQLFMADGDDLVDRHGVRTCPASVFLNELGAVRK